MTEAGKRNIIVAVDKSIASEQVCEWTANNLVRSGDTVYLVHVAKLPHSEGEVSFDVPDVRQNETLHAAATRHILADETAFIEDKFVPHLKGAPYKIDITGFARAHHHGAKSAGEAVCERAKTLDATMLVMASHDKTAAQKFFLGSTSTYCSTHSEMPVVIVRTG